MITRINQNRIKSNSYVPKYVQLKEILLGLINSDEVKIGEKIPSLNQLKNLYQVSDATCKKTISELVYEGVLKGEWGKGVFVISKFPHSPLENINLLLWGGDNVLRHPAFSEVVSGIINQITQFRHHLVFTIIDPVTQEKEKVKEVISQINASSVIIPFIPHLTEEMLLPLKAKNIPVVFIHKKFSGISDFFVKSNLDEFICKAVEKFIDSGKSEIAFLGFPWESGLDTLEKVEKIFKRKNLSLDKNLIERSDGNFEAGRRAVKKILKKGIVPNLVIALDDYVGYGALEVLEEAGLEIPQDVQVLGVGGFLKEYPFKPKLSTISMPFFECGREGARLILKILEEEATEGEITIPCKMDLGETFMMERG